jgi:peptidyl-prolyl cis-trans isomerase C
MDLAGRLFREPLIYFLLTGAALFAAGEFFGGDDGQRIVVTDGERQRLADQWQVQMGRPPSHEELEGLTEQWIREEIYYREALAAGLDQDDVIIRRRLAQKLAFLSEDLTAARAPEERALRDWHQAHAQRYREPQRFTFSHRYFSTERREDAQADAQAALASAAEPPDGDPFMLQQRYLERSQSEIAELFGREFAQALTELPRGEWQGPVRSAYGWHLVKLEACVEARALSFDEAAPRVVSDYTRDERQRASEAFYDSIRARYRVIRP